MEIVWEIVRHALGLTISAALLSIGALWLWISLDGLGKLQVSVIPLFLAVGFGQGLFGVVGGITATIVFTPITLWMIRRIV
jgi:hypothetical protein